jgi:hypothetical protein
VTFWKTFGAALLLAAATAARSGETPIDVVAGKPGVFIHLDASGRKNLAVAGGTSPGLGRQPERRAALPSGRLPPMPAFREYPLGRGECFEPAVWRAGRRPFSADLGG